MGRTTRAGTDRVSGRAGAVLLAAALLAACAPERPAPGRVVVLGLDGATWTIVRPLVAAGELPHLAALMARGVTATPVAEPPLIAPVVWTTVFTGVAPSRHGVAGWATAGAGYRRVPALWTRADAAGKGVVAVNVPGTWKAERLRHGTIVADAGMTRAYLGGAGTGAIGRLDAATPLPRPYEPLAGFLREIAYELAPDAWSGWRTTPVTVLAPGVLRVKRLDAARFFVSPIYPRALGRHAVHPAPVAAELEEALGVPYVREGPNPSSWKGGEAPAAFAEHLAQVAALQLEATRHLARTREAALVVWVDPLPDRIQHAYWAEHDTDQHAALASGRVARHGARVREAYRAADAHLGALLAVASPTWAVVVSAHGFGPAPGRAGGDHAPEGVLVVAGPALAGEHAVIGLPDVAATLACLLGVPRDGMTGTPLAAVARALDGCR